MKIVDIILIVVILVIFVFCLKKTIEDMKKGKCSGCMYDTCGNHCAKASIIANARKAYHEEERKTH